MTVNPILIEGFIVSIGLLMAIGPQNAYLLRQGLRKACWPDRDSVLSCRCAFNQLGRAWCR